jgi:hypothetical protein
MPLIRTAGGSRGKVYAWKPCRRREPHSPAAKSLFRWMSCNLNSAVTNTPTFLELAGSLLIVCPVETATSSCISAFADGRSAASSTIGSVHSLAEALVLAITRGDNLRYNPTIVELFRLLARDEAVPCRASFPPCPDLNPGPVLTVTRPARDTAPVCPWA